MYMSTDMLYNFCKENWMIKIAKYVKHLGSSEIYP